MDISGSIALVTGAGSKRLGRHFAMALAARGAKIAVHYLNSSSEANETVERIRSAGGSAGAFKADLSDSDQVIELANQVKQKFGHYNILINSASLFGRLELKETTADDWDAHFALNLRAPFLLAQLMLGALPQGTSGKIVNIGDWHTATPSRFPYGVTKAGLTGLTRSLAVSMAPQVQVNQVALGAILSPAGDGIAPSDASQFHGRNAKSIQNLRLCKRMGDPAEVVQIINTLIDNDYITGQTVKLTGGVDVW